MRALATEAGVGFATPFNHFGSKNAIMRGLSARVIERMADQYRGESPRGDSIQRVLAIARIAAELAGGQLLLEAAGPGQRGLRACLDLPFNC